MHQDKPFACRYKLFINKYDTMKISNHALYYSNGKKVPQVITPNTSGGYTPQYLVIHYTAATTARSTVNWFMKKIAYASAHLLIDRDGSITQFAPFNKITWHAGQSRWANLYGLNKYSIGIELVNGGKLVKSENSWCCPIDRKKIPANQVMMTTHKNEETENGWHEYTKQQIDAAIEVGALLTSHYHLKDVLGHDDISPFRKTDPGPAFPMSSYRSAILGRKDDDIFIYTTTSTLNIRAGAGTQYEKISKALPKDTKVQVLKVEGNWSFVTVLGKVHGIMDLEGWVYNQYLQQL